MQLWAGIGSPTFVVECLMLLGLCLGRWLHRHLSLSSSCGAALVLYSSRLFFLDRPSYVKISFISALNWESKERKKKKVKSNRWLKWNGREGTTSQRGRDGNKVQFRRASHDRVKHTIVVWPLEGGNLTNCSLLEDMAIISTGELFRRVFACWEGGVIRRSPRKLVWLCWSFAVWALHLVKYTVYSFTKSLSIKTLCNSRLQYLRHASNLRVQRQNVLRRVSAFLSGYKISL